LRFSPATQRYYLGNVEECYVGYSSDLEIRARCASGGIVSTCLSESLESGRIDGAMVTRLGVEDGQISAVSYIAKTREDILRSSGSIYFNVEPDWKSLLRFKGYLAVVGLPCHLRILNRWTENDSALALKIRLRIGLFCGHNSRKDLLLNLLRKKGIDVREIKNLRFRKGRWRGNMQVKLIDDKIIEFPFSDFSVYQNLNFFSLRKCLYCNDHTAEISDIACGDVWLRKMKREPIKHSVFLTRTPVGREIIQRLLAAGRIRARTSTPFEIFQSQKRSLILHKGLYARSKISGLFGMKIPCTDRGDIRWNDYLAAFIAVLNARCSENDRFNRFLFRAPKQLLYLYMLAYKLTHNF